MALTYDLEALWEGQGRAQLCQELPEHQTSAGLNLLHDALRVARPSLTH